MNLVIDDYAFKPYFEQGFQSVLYGEKTSLERSCKEGNYKNLAEDNVLYKLNSFEVANKKVIDFVADTVNCYEVEWKWVSYSNHLPVLF